MNQITVTGMVLQAAPIGEYDRRIVILTKEMGRISAFARGARRQNSSLAAAANPFSFGEFTMYQGRDSFTVVSATITNYFAELREDITGACYGFYFLELANYYTREGNDESGMLGLLYQTMKALVNPHISNALVRCVYELRALCLNGEGPQVFGCVHCGRKESSLIFSVKHGGLLCETCGQEAADGIQLQQSTLYAMQFIESRPLKSLYTFAVKEDVLVQLQTILKKYMERYIDKQFQSLTMLETITT